MDLIRNLETGMRLHSRRVVLNRRSAREFRAAGQLPFNYVYPVVPNQASSVGCIFHRPPTPHPDPDAFLEPWHFASGDETSRYILFTNDDDGEDTGA